MRLTELICSILIFSLIVACTALSFTTVVKQSTKTEDKLKERMYVLDVDYQLREVVKKIEVPYWKNVEVELEKNISNFIFNQTNREIDIENISITKNEENRILVVYITWKFNEIEYETVEKVSVRQILNGRH